MTCMTCYYHYLCNPMSHAHDNIVPFKNSGLSKKDQVRDMFDQIAGRYDKLNRFLSGGTDLGWRKKAILQLKDDDPKFILDVATGTADMAILACRLLKPERVLGIDISREMLELGKKKVEKEGLESIIQL